MQTYVSRLARQGGWLYRRDNGRADFGIEVAAGAKRANQSDSLDECGEKRVQVPSQQAIYIRLYNNRWDQISTYRPGWEHTNTSSSRATLAVAPSQSICR